MTQTSQPGPARPVPSAADLSAAGLPGPIERPRRLRSGAAMRSLVREHKIGRAHV